ncbi:cell division ATP-binding protein FtsE [bacterium]|nr:cell division ATP-binding protein FtsE [bacterium]
MSKQAVVKVRGLTKIYPPNVRALVDVSFDLYDEEFVCLIGPSGAGKSTLIKLMICEERPTRGHIFVAGKDITQLRPSEIPYYRRRVGVVFQDFKLLPRRTVYENVAFALEVADAHPKEIRERVPFVLDLVGLRERANHFPDTLSGGEKQRVAIARAIVNGPKLLIADEPTGNLDPRTSWEIINLLLEINKRGTMILLATHNKEIVDRLHKRVIVLDKGRIVSTEKRTYHLR